MYKRVVSVLTMLSFVVAGTVLPVAHAGMITTDSYVQQADAEAKRVQVAQMLKREDVRERMLAMGVDPANVEARLGALTDAEIATLSQHIEEMPAGAGVLGVLAFVLLVFVILDIAGVTDVFPFINSAK